MICVLSLTSSHLYYLPFSLFHYTGSLAISNTHLLPGFALAVPSIWNSPLQTFPGPLPNFNHISAQKFIIVTHSFAHSKCQALFQVPKIQENKVPALVKKRAHSEQR